MLMLIELIKLYTAGNIVEVENVQLLKEDNR